MNTLLLPDFIADLQENPAPHFARRVLQKTLQANGSFRQDKDDHRYKGVTNAWIRYVSAGRSAYRVIYIRDEENIYLYRAGEHRVENNLSEPKGASFDAAVSVGEAGTEVADAIASISSTEAPEPSRPPVNRFRRNVPTPEIGREILSRRNLPHKDIWLVSPFVNRSLFTPTARLGKLLLEQVEDGARVVLVTRPPSDKNIDWLETLQELSVDITSVPNCFCMVIALTAEISQFTILFFDYILSRVHRQIVMSILDKDDTVDFVQKILDSNRVNDDGERGHFPFEKGAVEAIASHLTEITPRKIVNTMQQVIEEARLAGHDPTEGPVSLDFLDDHDIVEEVIGDGGAV